MIDVPGDRPDMTIATALRDAVAAMGPAASTARLDAELLMAHALGVSRSDLLLRHMRDVVPGGFAALLARRLADEPVAYILGSSEFYGLELAVSPAVLIPRQDSEILIDAARAALADHPPARILDCGTGSGALLLAAASLWPDAEAIGIDRSPDALSIAAANAARHAPATQLRQRDWSQPGWANDLGRFELILANPPYVEDDAVLENVVRDHEPHGALFAGPEGLDDYRRLIPQLPALLSPDGVAVMEIGSRQADAVSAIASAQGFSVRLHHDLGGRPRALQLNADPGNISLGKGQPSA